MNDFVGNCERIAAMSHTCANRVCLHAWRLMAGWILFCFVNDDEAIMCCLGGYGLCVCVYTNIELTDAYAFSPQRTG